MSVPRWRHAQAAGLDLLPSVNVLRNGLVLDIGANVGDWTAALLTAEPSVSVIAAEPGDEPYATLTQRFSHDPRVALTQCAVAERAGPRTFHVTAHNHNASLRAPLPGMDVLYGFGWEETGTCEVDVTTVDKLAAGRDIALLKIDVQGAELDVLAGAAATLPRTSAVMLEVTFVSHYEHDASFAVLHAQMTTCGFELSGLSRPFLSRRHTVLWCDACYTRSS